MKGKHVNWTEKKEVLLGTRSDESLAAELGTTHRVIRYRRMKLGIPAFQPQVPKTEWTPEMDALLGTMADWKVEVDLGVPEGSAFRRRRNLNLPSQRKKN